jgi:hypothetical protein
VGISEALFKDLIEFFLARELDAVEAGVAGLAGPLFDCRPVETVNAAMANARNAFVPMGARKLEAWPGNALRGRK